MPAIRLFTIPGSHPGLTTRLMLARKSLPYKRTDLFPVVSKGVLKALRFPGVTVPAMTIDGRRVQGSIAIAHELDRVAPEPPLYPSDPAELARVTEAERFGDAELQHPIRQILWWALRKDAAPLASFSRGAKLGIPIGLAVKTAAPVVAASAHFNEASDENVRADLAALPGLLDRTDAFIAGGVIGNDEPNAADFQLATSIALAMTLDDLAPLFAGRPCARLARALVPEYPGRIPPVLPPEWLPLAASTKVPAQ